MYKKLTAISIIAIFIIISLGVISATDNTISIPVKIVWDGDCVDEVTVNLLKEGRIIKTTELNNTNSWNTTFNVTDDGEYNVSVLSDDFTSSVKGDMEKGFIVSCKLLKDDSIKDNVLGATEDNNSSNSDDVIAETTNNLSDENTIGGVADNSSNTTVLGASGDANSSNNNTNVSGDNQTNNNINSNSDSDKQAKKDNKNQPDNEKEKKSTVNTTVETKIIKEPKKEKQPVKSKKNNTGFPIVILIIAVFVAAFIPLSRRK